MGRYRTVIQKTAFVGITALLAMISTAHSRAWAEAPADQPLAPETADQWAGVSASGTIEKLTVNRCLEIARQNSPNILAASLTMSATRERVGQAWSAYYPQASLAGAYTKRDSIANVPLSTYTPLAQDYYSWTATLNQNIFDFGRTGAQVTIREKDLDAAREDLRDAIGQIVFNVKSAYYGLLRAVKSRDVLKETVALFERQLEEAKGFYEAGVRSRFDVTNAEVELSNARLNLVRAENALRLAQVALKNAMGVPDAEDFTVEDTLAFQKYAVTFDEARARAFQNRPDMRSMAARRESGEQSLSLARKGHFPSLSGNATVSRSGENYPPDQDTWSVGVTLTIPLFSGFLTTHQVRETNETLGAIKANEKALRQNILLAVQQAHIKLQEAEERIAVAELSVKQAEENYDLAHSRYEEGVGSPIEETNALVSLSNARTNHVAALADYKVAEAELQRAMGE